MLSVVKSENGPVHILVTALALAACGAAEPVPTTGSLTQPVPPRDLSVRLRNHYPPPAVAAGMGGEALARVALSETGEVLLVRIESRTDTMFADACEAMLRETRWEPARRGGRAIAVVVPFRCTFVVGNARRPPMEEIRDVIREHAPEIAICHGPIADVLEGEVVVEWLSDRAGRVQRARIVSSPIDDASFERCLLTAWRTWDFPESSMDEVFVYSLRFGY